MSESDFAFPGKPEIEKRSENTSNLMNALFFIGMIVAFSVLFELSMVFLFGMVLVLVLHELGHFLAMKFFKYDNVQIKVVPLLGFAIQGEKAKYSQKERVLIALAGPIPSLFIASLVIILVDVPPAFMEEFSLIMVAMIVINILNLLPLDMFDGGKLLEYMFFSTNDQARLVFAFTSSIVIILIGIYFKSYIVAGFGFLIGIKVKSFHKLRDIRRGLKNDNVKFHSTLENLSNRAYWLIRDKVIESSKTLSQVVPSNREEWENEPLLMHHIEEVLEVPIKDDLSISGKIGVGFLWILAIAYPIYLVLSSNLIQSINVF